MILQMITVIEYKHIFGHIYDDHGPIDLNEELEMFYDIQNKLKDRYPLFKIKVIAVGLKKGNYTGGSADEHIKSQIEAYLASQEYTPKSASSKSTESEKLQNFCRNLVVGFDMVQEEDTSTPIGEYAEIIYEAKLRAQREGKHFDLYLHAGESNERVNENLYDAICMGTKRIGHGFQIAHHPSLIQEVIDKNICVEVNPVSNFVLGYTLDLRTHPVRGLLQAGVPVSISSDDPSLFHYDGVTLDFVYAFLAWELNLADLKQLCVNSITYSSLDEKE